LTVRKIKPKINHGVTITEEFKTEFEQVGPDMSASASMRLSTATKSKSRLRMLDEESAIAVYCAIDQRGGCGCASGPDQIPRRVLVIASIRQ
jgi:hypothetical protein